MKQIEDINPEDIDVEMASETAEWQEVMINTTKAVYKNRVNLEIQEKILELAKEKLKEKV